MWPVENKLTSSCTIKHNQRGQTLIWCVIGKRRKQQATFKRKLKG